MWRIQSEGYVVPYNGPGEKSDTVFHSGASWVGGLDELGNIKLAGELLHIHNRVDWWPGPIEEAGISPYPQTCRDWDQLFEVRFEDLERHRTNIRKYIENGMEYPVSEIPDRIKYWPGSGNPFFSVKYDFELPNLTQGIGYILRLQ
jgi:hypothetical protein